LEVIEALLGVVVLAEIVLLLQLRQPFLEAASSAFVCPQKMPDMVVYLRASYQILESFVS
jgi:hypothetical protein